MKPKAPFLSKYDGLQLNFNGDLWRVRMVPKFKNPNQEGHVDWMKMEIQIKRGMGREKTHQRFWHEIVHCFEWYQRFQLRHEHVDKVAQGLAELFFTNKTTLKEFFK